MAQVAEFYAARPLADGSVVERVVIAGDWNLPATDRAFADLEQAVPGTLVAPNVKSSVNSKGQYVSSYDHFVWNGMLLSVDFADEPRDIGGLNLLQYRQSLSDHAGVAGYVLAQAGKPRPKEVNCPPARVGVQS